MSECGSRGSSFTLWAFRVEYPGMQNGGMAERLNATVLKTVGRRESSPGFESPSLRQQAKEPFLGFEPERGKRDLGERLRVSERIAAQREARAADESPSLRQQAVFLSNIFAHAIAAVRICQFFSHVQRELGHNSSFLPGFVADPQKTAAWLFPVLHIRKKLLGCPCPVRFRGGLTA